MQKISLKNLNLKEVEKLSREQLKDVLGGNLGSGSPTCSQSCKMGPVVSELACWGNCTICYRVGGESVGWGTCVTSVNG
ncbi:hypothetical protein [Sphingobacterium deserti]|uniref:Uncharacterized protein n=1 Tax=Sphingobacterium deserti TaxID=1229276 RepID=A0A0B8SZY8_9SPHI|nr:hypothetical protein [Sphingobacterium deserti]KGE13336.1 hypothetical protein DI53_2867 [Sphingobacterium deserti]